MGWGAKRAAPQPVELPRIDPVLDEEPEAPAEKLEPGKVAELAWMHFQANKGWLQERRERVLREFIGSKGLYPELVAYAKKLR
jgi:hypothetical protein